MDQTGRNDNVTQRPALQDSPKILMATVAHKRLFPRVNGFAYGIYYLAVPLDRMDRLNDGFRFGVNRAGLLSIHDKDHAECDGKPLLPWVRDILAGEGLDRADGAVVLVTMPRVLGYVFNPVSFWLCHDSSGGLRAVICEVHNTFGERHSYLCRHDDQRVISPDDILTARKLFHVSPFLKREGHYTFRFNVQDERFGVWIDFFDGQGRKQLVTSLAGKFEDYDRPALRRAFWRYPLVTLRAIWLIHYQALKLVMKGIKYISKPAQIMPRLSRTQNLTKK